MSLCLVCLRPSFLLFSIVDGQEEDKIGVVKIIFSTPSLSQTQIYTFHFKYLALRSSAARHYARRRHFTDGRSICVERHFGKRHFTKQSIVGKIRYVVAPNVSKRFEAIFNLEEIYPYR
jgi:hypothetical protein